MSVAPTPGLGSSRSRPRPLGPRWLDVSAEQAQVQPGPSRVVRDLVPSPEAALPSRPPRRARALTRPHDVAGVASVSIQAREVLLHVGPAVGTGSSGCEAVGEREGAPHAVPREGGQNGGGCLVGRSAPGSPLQRGVPLLLGLRSQGHRVPQGRALLEGNPQQASNKLCCPPMKSIKKAPPLSSRPISSSP